MVLYTVFILALFLGSVIIPLQVGAVEFEAERERCDPSTYGTATRTEAAPDSIRVDQSKI